MRKLKKNTWLLGALLVLSVAGGLGTYYFFKPVSHGLREPAQELEGIDLFVAQAGFEVGDWVVTSDNYPGQIIALIGVDGTQAKVKVRTVDVWEHVVGENETYSSTSAETAWAYAIGNEGTLITQKDIEIRELMKSHVKHFKPLRKEKVEVRELDDLSKESSANCLGNICRGDILQDVHLKSFSNSFGLPLQSREDFVKISRLYENGKLGLHVYDVVFAAFAPAGPPIVQYHVHSEIHPSEDLHTIEGNKKIDVTYTVEEQLRCATQREESFNIEQVWMVEDTDGVISFKVSIDDRWFSDTESEWKPVAASELNNDLIQKIRRNRVVSYAEIASLLNGLGIEISPYGKRRHHSIIVSCTTL